EQVIACDDIVTCYVRPNIAFYQEMVDAGLKVFNIGDSDRPGNLSHAVHAAGDFILNFDDKFILNANNCFIKDVPLEVQDILSK
ncbi:MAG: hypothetical protein IKR67_05170, partial [Lachnospiraceae bacterium]|nr:hypothetical protein [Lachnospiraceae bacterium]